jgi:hypothetical protein
MELTNVGDRWISDNGVPVEFGAIFAVEGMGQAPTELVMTAAGRPS